MSIFEWKDIYSVGIEIIDEQHKVLIGLINQLDTLVNENYRQAEVQALFQELIDYTNYHFDTEEQLMHNHHYEPANLQKHILQHQQFRHEIASVLSDIAHISLEDCRVILSYLTNWLVNHICKVDHHLGDFILAQQIEQEGIEQRKESTIEENPLGTTLREQIHKNIYVCERNLPQLLDSMQKLLVIVQHYESCTRNHLHRDIRETLDQALTGLPEARVIHHESVSLIKEIESGQQRLARMLRHFNHDSCRINEKPETPDDE